ncbi:hypothetical protein QYM36_005126 [Artemia franciscana]|uniref:Uncharacterized protein n=1 Tax=Artemia franciscana TaxID=6661 RepID=A0AA88I1A2_ARTSF|nr:hypothetical protein QYM36_005126 [Artemia franciscana]
MCTMLLLLTITVVASFPLNPVRHKIISIIEPQAVADETLSSDSDNIDKQQESSLGFEITAVEPLNSDPERSVININSQEKSNLDTGFHSLKSFSGYVLEGMGEVKHEPKIEVSRAKRSPGRGRKKGYEFVKIDPQLKNLRFILQN